MSARCPHCGGPLRAPNTTGLNAFDEATRAWLAPRIKRDNENKKKSKGKK